MHSESPSNPRYTQQEIRNLEAILAFRDKCNGASPSLADVAEKACGSWGQKTSAHHHAKVLPEKGTLVFPADEPAIRGQIVPAKDPGDIRRQVGRDHQFYEQEDQRE